MFVIVTCHFVTSVSTHYDFEIMVVIIPAAR